MVIIYEIFAIESLSYIYTYVNFDTNIDIDIDTVKEQKDCLTIS